jgi:hypothetical protein
MPVARDDSVPGLKTPSHQRHASRDRHRAQERHDRRDPKQRGTTAFPATVAIADVHRFQQDILRRRVVELCGRSLEREKAQLTPAVEPVEDRRGPRAEPAVGVEQNDEPGAGVGRGHGQARTIICARSGPTLTWLIRTPASASRRPTYARAGSGSWSHERQAVVSACQPGRSSYTGSNRS